MAKIIRRIKKLIWRNFGWEKMDRDNIPSWIWDRIHKEFKKRRNAYDKIYFYKGKHFRYKVKITSEQQGGCYYFYKKKRSEKPHNIETPLEKAHRKLLYYKHKKRSSEDIAPSLTLKEILYLEKKIKKWRIIFHKLDKTEYLLPPKEKKKLEEQNKSHKQTQFQ